MGFEEKNNGRIEVKENFLTEMENVLIEKENVLRERRRRDEIVKVRAGGKGQNENNFSLSFLFFLSLFFSLLVSPKNIEFVGLKFVSLLTRRIERRIKGEREGEKRKREERKGERKRRREREKAPSQHESELELKYVHGLDSVCSYIK